MVTNKGFFTNKQLDCICDLIGIKIINKNISLFQQTAWCQNISKQHGEVNDQTRIMKVDSAEVWSMKFMIYR